MTPRYVPDPRRGPEHLGGLVSDRKRNPNRATALIAEARKALGLRQCEFGRLVGVSPNTVSRVETGKVDPGPLGESLAAVILACPESVLALRAYWAQLEEKVRAVPKPTPRAKEGTPLEEDDEDAKLESLWIDEAATLLRALEVEQLPQCYRERIQRLLDPSPGMRLIFCGLGGRSTRSGTSLRGSVPSRSADAV